MLNIITFSLNSSYYPRSERISNYPMGHTYAYNASDFQNGCPSPFLSYYEMELAHKTGNMYHLKNYYSYNFKNDEFTACSDSDKTTISMAACIMKNRGYSGYQTEYDYDQKNQVYVPYILDFEMQSIDDHTAEQQYDFINSCNDTIFGVHGIWSWDEEPDHVYLDYEVPTNPEVPYIFINFAYKPLEPNIQYAVVYDLKYQVYKYILVSNNYNSYKITNNRGILDTLICARLIPYTHTQILSSTPSPTFYYEFPNISEPTINSSYETSNSVASSNVATTSLSFNGLQLGLNAYLGYRFWRDNFAGGRGRVGMDEPSA